MLILTKIILLRCNNLDFFCYAMKYVNLKTSNLTPPPTKKKQDLNLGDKNEVFL